MKKFAVVLMALILLPCAQAGAEGGLGPTQAELQADNALAVAYWHAELPTAVVMAPELPENRAAQANWGTGQIEMSEQYDWRDFPGLTCSVYVHEYGHFVLGPFYFAATNPTDPRHSPDPNNIMYGGGEPGNGPMATRTQVETQAASVGCPPVQPPEPAASPAPRVVQKTHHKHRHRTRRLR